MKRINPFIIAALFIVSLSSAYAQDTTKTTVTTKEQKTISTTPENDYQTIFGNNNSKAFGGFIGLNSKYTRINDQDALLIGGEIDAVISHSFNIGLKGFGMVSSNRSTQLNDLGEQLYLGVGYGGLNLEPVLFYNSAVHFSLPVLLGAGGIVEYSKYNYYDYHHPHYYNKYNYDYFFLVEPGVNLELNVVKFMRVSTGVSYRFTSDIKMDGLAGNDLNGFNFDLSLKFGWF